MGRMTGASLALLVIMLLRGALAPAAAAQQVELSPYQTAVACSQAPATGGDTLRPLRVAGDEGTVAHSLFDGRDRLVINAGTAAGLRPGQEYFLRRLAWGAGYARRRAVTTDGWVRIVSAGPSRAAAVVEHACGAIHENDYLEPFQPPAMPGPPTAATPGGLIPGSDVSVLGRVVFGDDERTLAGPGDFLLIEGSTGPTAALGTRLTIYRHVRTPPRAYRQTGQPPVQLPLAPVGEAVVVSIGRRMAVAQVVDSRDAIWSGDMVALRLVP